MDCHYINLDSAEARRQSVENSFRAHQKPAWRLTRFPAVGVDYVCAHDVRGLLRPSEKACFLSHRRLLEASLAHDRHVMVMEDDAVFGRHTCGVVDHFLAQQSGLAWDVVLTDACIPQAATMAELLKLRQQLASGSEVKLLNLAAMPFGGATAYLVNAKSKRKLFSLLSAADPLDIPYDLYLRQLIYDGKVSGHVFFPFITSLSDLSDSSQVQRPDSWEPDVVWNLFRKMVWMDRDLEKQKPVLAGLGGHAVEGESGMFGALFALLASGRFRAK